MDLDANNGPPHKRQRLNNEEEQKIQDIPNEISFFTKKIFGKQKAAIETKYVVFQGQSYRAKYSSGHKFSTNARKKTKWVCTRDKCVGEIQTCGAKFNAFVKGHNSDCIDKHEKINVRKEQSLQRMKQAVAIGVKPRDAYESEILLGTAEDFWGYQEVAARLYDVRRQNGIPKLPERKEDIANYLIGTSSKNFC